MSKERLEEIRTRLKYGLGCLKHLRREILNSDDESLKDQINLLENDIKFLFEQAERVQELESFKKSVEYTVDSETLELIISNQDDDIVLSLSETYDEKIFLLQKRVQELERANRQLEKQAPGIELDLLNQELTDALRQNKRYRDMLVKIFKIVQNHQIMKISDEDYADAATFLYKWIYDTGAIDREKHFSEVHGHDEFDSHQINLLFKEHMSQKSSKALEGESDA